MKYLSLLILLISGVQMSFSQGKGDRSLYFYDEEHDLACEITNIVYDYQLFYHSETGYYIDGNFSCDIMIKGGFYEVYRVLYKDGNRLPSRKQISEVSGDYLYVTESIDRISEKSTIIIMCKPTADSPGVNFGPIDLSDYVSQEDLEKIGQSGIGDVVVDSEPETVSVYNLQGHILKTCDQDEEISADLAPGFYVIVFKDKNDNFVTKKMIVK